MEHAQQGVPEPTDKYSAPTDEYLSMLRALEWARRATSLEDGICNLGAVIIHGTRVGDDGIYSELANHLCRLVRPDSGLKDLEGLVNYIFTMAEIHNPDARKQASDLVDAWEDRVVGGG